MEYFINVYEAGCDHPSTMAHYDREWAAKCANEMPIQCPAWKYIHTIQVVNDVSTVIDLRGE